MTDALKRTEPDELERPLSLDERLAELNRPAETDEEVRAALRLPFRGWLRSAVDAAKAHATAVEPHASGPPFEPSVVRIHRIGPSAGACERRSGRVAVELVINAAGHQALVGVTADLEPSIWQD